MFSYVPIQYQSCLDLMGKRFLKFFLLCLNTPPPTHTYSVALFLPQGIKSIDGPQLAENYAPKLPVSTDSSVKSRSSDDFLTHSGSFPNEVKWSEVAQSCPTLCDPVDCSPPDSSVHGILQGRTLEWVAISFSRRSSQPRDQTQVSCIAGRCFNLWATREAFPNTFLLFLQFSFCYLPQICHTPFISVAVWPT